MKKLLFSILLIFLWNISNAAKLPYYVSIKNKAEEANIRTGPSIRYPIRWVYKKPNWPMKVVATFENWRKVEDIYGEAGWIHETLLSGAKYAVIKANGLQEIRRLNVANSAVMFMAENEVIAKIIKCKDLWCKIEIEDMEGWVEKKNLWGVK